MELTPQEEMFIESIREAQIPLDIVALIITVDYVRKAKLLETEPANAKDMEYFRNAARVFSELREKVKK